MSLRSRLRASRSGKTRDYSGFRSGLVDFTESAIGLGDEIDAGIRTLTGESRSFNEGLDQSRRDLDYFERNNKVASGALDVLGIGASMLVPGLGAAKVAQTGSRLARAVKVGTLGAVEGAAYGYATGRDEGRVDSAQTGAMFGGAIGAGMGAFLTKNADDIAKAAKVDEAKKVGRGTFFGGEEGFDKTIKAAQEKRLGGKSKFETSAAKRKINSVDRDALAVDDIARSPTKDTTDAIALNSRAWGVKNVNERFTRLVEDGESGIRRAHVAIDDTFDKLDPLFQRLAYDDDMKEGLLNLGVKPNSAVRARFGIADEGIMTFDKIVAKAKSPEERQALEEFRKLLDETRMLDLEDWVKAGEWAPRTGGAASADGLGVMSAYGSPSEALRTYAKDVTDAQVLMQRFELSPEDIKRTGEGSRMDAVIAAVERKLAAESTEDIAANGANLMRSVYIASRTGGDAMGAMARKLASTGLLANPINAVLNLSETVTAPVYQNGVKAWAGTLPRAIRSILSKKMGTADQKFLSQHQLGIEKQFAGELMSEGKSTMGKWLDWASEGLYKYTGTSLSHRAGQEVLANSAINRAKSLIKKGDLAKLRRHDGMKGLTSSEFDETVAAISRMTKEGLDALSPREQSWVMNFSGASMNKWQAISALSMPKAFLDNPNGRIGYSMLSYMNINMNNLRTDVGLNLLDIQKYGLNSKQGQAAFKKAAKASAKYAALFGVFAGVWDDMRKTMDLTNDKELKDVFTFDGVANAALNQFASNMSSGLVNIRAEEFGGDTVSLMPAPISLGLKGANAVADLATGDVDPALRFTQQAVPGFSQADRLSRMGMLSSVGITSRPEKLFESLGLLDD